MNATPPPEEMTSLYVAIGGSEPIAKLVHQFYLHMSQLEEASEIKAMHPDLARAETKLYEFLVGWMGGPQLYIEKYGHPRLRARHLPFAIGESARDQWLLCMDKALGETVESKELQEILSRAFANIANHMINQEKDVSYKSKLRQLLTRS